jgi:hypothetical protein
MKSSSESISALLVVVTGVGGAGSVEARFLFFGLGSVSASTALRFFEVGMVATVDGIIVVGFDREERTRRGSQHSG